MPYKLPAHNCMMTGIFTGTGPDFTVSAETGRQSFSVFGTGSGNTFDVTIRNRDADQWARCKAYMSDSATMVIASTEESSTGSTIDWDNGTKDIVNDFSASDQAAAVRFTAQSLSDGEKAQARANINAMSMIGRNQAARVGSFSVWQRGTSLAVAASTSAAYQNDGWYVLTNANQAATIARVAGIAAGSQYAAKVQRNSGQTGTSIMRYMAPLDDDEIAPLLGKHVALSFTAKAGADWSPSSGTLTYKIYVGTGAPAKRQTTTYTGETEVISGTVNLTTTAGRVTATSAAVWPSNATQAEIQFYWTPSGTAGADDSFTIDDLQLETVDSASGVATPFVPVAYQQLLALAQRHLYVLKPGTAASAFVMGAAYSTTQCLFVIPLPVTMRTPPSVTVSSAGHFIGYPGSGSYTVTSFTVNKALPDSVAITAAGASTTVGFSAFLGGQNADAAMNFSAEI